MSARYAPSANSEPWARLITSITPRISMNPSAISANKSPRLTPLTRCGSRSCVRQPISWASRVRPHSGERVDPPAGSRAWRERGDAHSSKVGVASYVSSLHAMSSSRASSASSGLVQLTISNRSVLSTGLVVAARHVDRLLQVVRARIHVGAVMLHAVDGGYLELLELLDDRDVVGRARALDRAQQLARAHVAVVAKRCPGTGIGASFHRV